MEWDICLLFSFLFENLLACYAMNLISKQNVKFSFAVVGEFGRIAVEFLKKGSNPKIYEGAASKLYYFDHRVTFNDYILHDRIVSNSFSCGLNCLLGKLSVPAETVQHGVEGLMFILTESSKLMVRALINL